jgi:hypothetical protein
MEKANDILNELRSMSSPLADMSRTMPYGVPEGYFNVLINEIQDSISMENVADPVVGWSKNNPYSIPNGYFDSLAQQVLSRIVQAEPSLPLSKENPFSAPAGYFEQLPQQILAAAKASETEKKTRVIQFRPNVRKTIRWAAAALLVLGIGIGSYKALEKPSYEKQLASLPQSAVNEYVQQGIDDFDMEAIESSLVMNTKTDATPLKTENLKKEEINEYLNEMGG